MAGLLGFRSSGEDVGPFDHVFVNGGLTIDFDAILVRIQSSGVPYSSSARGPVDLAVDTRHGFRIADWNEPDGHPWEMLTESYARRL